MKGIFELSAPRDLLAKLTHDYARLQRTPDDAYVAFDFFVTAEHMLDWLYPGAEGKPQRTAERNANILLQVVSHLATGAKHMIPEAPHHNTVYHADVAFTPYGSGAYGSGTYGGRTLLVELDGTAAAALGHSVTPLALAERVLMHWTQHDKLQ